MNELICFALKSPFPGHGWGNGYVALPTGHPLYGKDYFDIDDIYINGALTYSDSYTEGRDPVEAKDMWILGFDTQHSWDTPNRWPDEQSILKECEVLKRQLIAYEAEAEPSQD